MGYAVLHMVKGSGSTGGMQGHNERTYEVKNADPERANLNFYVGHPNKKIEVQSENPRTGSYKDRESAIIENRHTGRKIRANAVKRLSFALSGSHEQMKKIEKAGHIEAWAKYNYKFMGEKFGYQNITEFAVHLDERTPHIHCMVVPMVKTEKGEKLCAKDLTSRDQLIELQTEYAEAMKPFGLERGLKGSRSTHDSVKEYYSKIENEKGELQEIREEKKHMYDLRDEAREKFLQVGKIAWEKMQSVLARKEVQKLQKDSNDLKKNWNDVKEKSKKDQGRSM